MGIDLNIAAVSKKFGDFEALKGIDLDIEEGSFVCLLGPSGCGKTTLLRIIAGFEQASAGQLLLGGRDISGLPPHKREFGMVFQSLALFPHMSVAENIAYGLKLRKVSKQDRDKRVTELLELISLPAIANRAVSELSGGQRQRVAIARALAVQPRLFLLDEPLSALDAQLRDAMQIELRQLQQKFGVTTILVTHDQTEAMMLADKLVVMKDGKICQQGAPQDLYQQPANAFTAEFLGASNILDARASNQGRVQLAGVDTVFATDEKPGTALKLSVRAESVLLGRGPDLSQGPVAEIEFIRNLGASTEILARMDTSTVRIRLSSKDAILKNLALGEQVALEFDPESSVVFRAEEAAAT